MSTPFEQYLVSARDRIDGPAWLRQVRAGAFDRFREAGLPTTRVEDYKYTDLTPLTKQPLQVATAGDAGDARALLAELALPAGPQLVFVNGRFQAAWSRLSAQPEVETADLATVVAADGARLQELLGSSSVRAQDPLTDLNLALWEDGALVRLRRGAIAHQPIHLVFLTDGREQVIASQPRVIVVLEDDSEATVLETYFGISDLPYFTNAATEIHAGANARLRHYRIQRESAAAYHTGSVTVHQERASRLSSSAISVGAKLARVAIQTTLNGEGSECSLDGLYLAGGEQHVDHHTTIDHRQPRTTSRELYKGILDQRATGVFNGKVYVRPHALKSDAQQMNKNLLLSDSAEVDTKPQLEIFADDVKCSHGATIGRLAEDALFFLRARGIDAPTARNLLIYAFANELVERIAVPAVRERLGTMLETRFHLAGIHSVGS